MTAELLPVIAKAANEAGILKDIYGDIAKPGVTQVGKALSTVLGLGNTLLWPIQLLNEKSRLLLEANLERYREKLAQIPLEKISPVSPEIGVPISEKLSYTQDIDLRELYTSLLAKASSSDTLNQAHPSFVNVINNLSPDEAKLLKQFKKISALPFITVRFTEPVNNIWNQVADLQTRISEDIMLNFETNLPAYLSNFEGLGLVTVSRNTYIVPLTIYDLLETVFKEKYKDESSAEYPTFSSVRGRIDLTPFGKLFIHSCVD